MMRAHVCLVPPTPSAPLSQLSPSGGVTLEEDDAIINPWYMMQLLTYGIRLGLEGKMLEGSDLEQEAKVRRVLS